MSTEGEASPVEGTVRYIPVCEVGGQTYYGTELEAVAARLSEGDKIIFNGAHETVDYTWFYEGPIIKLVSGKSVFPALGWVFELVPNAALTGAADSTTGNGAA